MSALRGTVATIIDTIATIATGHNGEFYTAADTGSAKVYQDRVYRFPGTDEARAFWFAAKVRLGGQLLAGSQTQFADTSSSWVTVTCFHPGDIWP